MTDKNSIAVVILAAGKGKRMQSTKPKVMHQIAGRPMLKWLIETAENLNPEKIIVVIGPNMDEVKTIVQPHQTVIQEAQNGTGDAVKAALPLLKGFSGKVLILLGDEPLLPQESLEKMLGWDGLSVMAVEPLSAKGLGRMVVHEDGTLDRIVEEKDATDDEKEIRLCNAGNFCVPGKHLEKWLSQISNKNAQKEYYLTDIPKIAEKDGFVTYVVEAEMARMRWGVNTRSELAEREQNAQNILREKAMENGATLLDPLTIYLSWDTKIGKDVVIGPNVVIGPGVEIADNVTIESFSHIEQTKICDHVKVGPFARLRGGTILNENTKVGNFVEMKNAIVGAGSKASHLSYIGDATLGERVNIGAGTITCNYDGFQKHNTTIGNDVFVGSNSALVAPVSIGDGAIIGAGSTINKDVTANSLSLTRAKIEHHDGWAKNYREKKKGKK